MLKIFLQEQYFAISYLDLFSKSYEILTGTKFHDFENNPHLDKLHSYIRYLPFSEIHQKYLHMTIRNMENSLTLYLSL